MRWNVPLDVLYDPRRNSLNALRLGLAGLVLLSHGVKLGGRSHDWLGSWTGDIPWTGTGVDIGTVAVDGFFVLSGFLITASYLRTSSLPRFLWHRCLRILPGFWTCLLVTAGVFAPVIWVVEHGTLGGFPVTGTDSASSFVTRNATLLIRQYPIDGLLQGTSVNGSLHTLFFEFVCYLLVGALGLVGILRTRPALVVLAAVGAWSAAGADAVTGGALTGGGTGRELLLRFVLMFLAGAVLHVHAARVPAGLVPATTAGLVLLAAFAIPETYVLLAPVALGVLLLTIGSSTLLSRVGRERDLSYGLYVYAWPVQILLLALGVTETGLGPYLALSLGLGLALAVVSWRWVESPALRAKSWTPPRWSAPRPLR